MKAGRLAALSVAMAMAGIGPVTADTVLHGTVASGDSAIANAKITLFSAGAKGSRVLAEDTSDNAGKFRLKYRDRKFGEVIYLLADGGEIAGARRNRAIRLLSVVNGAPQRVTVNELTTVAGAYALAQFLDGGTLSGTAPGLPNAGLVFSNLASDTGTPGTVIARSPNGSRTEALATLNSLASIISTCVRRAADCDALFAAAKPPGGRKPADTLAAAQAIALDPAARPEAVFALLPRTPLYGPVLTAAPSAWLIGLLYGGGGLDGPGAIAFDRDGNAWVTNNFMPPGTTAGNQLTVLDATGKPILGSPIVGGGLDGAGWGIAIADKGRVWVGNFHGSSVSTFSRQGKPETKQGFGQDKLVATQGIAVDYDGNVWAASNGTDWIVRFAGGDRNRARKFSEGGIEKPFSIAVDGSGGIWVANAGKTGSVSKLDSRGNAYRGSPFRFASRSSPKGMAIDSAGNVWVADFLSDGVFVLGNDGRKIAGPISTKAMDGAWGLALDGNENVWVAGFLTQRVTKLCGRKVRTCPPGSAMGDVISPPGGFKSEALQHLTSIAIDPSGNVWLANNWSQLDPIVGGTTMVAFIGAAAPVATPMLGPPQRP